MIGRNFILLEKLRKIKSIFSEHNAKNFAWKILPLPRNRQNNEMISLSCDVNERVYSKSKSIQLLTNSANIEQSKYCVMRNLVLS